MKTTVGSTSLVILLTFLGLGTAARAAGEEAGEWTFHWDKALRFASPDGNFKLDVGGRIHLDATFPDPETEIEDAFGPIADASELRRGRIYFKGTLYGNFEFKAEYDFAGGEAEVKDLYVGLTDTAVGSVRIGHFKEPFSLLELTSSNDIAFIERPLPILFAPSRNTGVMFHDESSRYTWALGAFRESDGFAFSEGDGQLNLTARLTGLPIYDPARNRLLHLGLSVSRKDLGDALLRYSQRPEVHLAPRFVDTGSLPASEVDLWDLELAVVSGRFWASAEYLGAEVDAVSPAADFSFGGYYVEAGWFLTGESRPYKASGAVFSGASPKKNFGAEGKGAWEIAFRYSTLDLTDSDLRGGELDNFTVALNWYLNPAARFMLDYVDSDVDGIGRSGFVSLRLQLVF